MKVIDLITILANEDPEAEVVLDSGWIGYEQLSYVEGQPQHDQVVLG